MNIINHSGQMKNKKVLREEKSVEGQFDEVVQELTEDLEKDELREEIFSPRRVIEELRNKRYKDYIKIKRLEEENQLLRRKRIE